MTKINCYSFNALPIGQEFTQHRIGHELTVWRKKSSRTATNVTYGGFSYFSTGELCYFPELPKQPLRYVLHLSSHIDSFGKPSVPAIEAGIIGHYVNGKPYKPCPVAVRAALPYRYRKAFDRACQSFYFDKYDNNAAATLTLYSSRDKWLNVVYAIPVDA